jgi:hypothetical protein
MTHTTATSISTTAITVSAVIAGAPFHPDPERILGREKQAARHQHRPPDVPGGTA